MCRSIISRLVPLLRPLCHEPRPQSTAVSPIINGDKLLEEERMPFYHPRHFYPVRLGDILNERYQIATKIGFGTYSTVWLARDLFQWRWLAQRYVVIKVNATPNPANPGPSMQDELRICELVSTADLRHPGRHFVRSLLDTFTLAGQSGNHVCFVFEPLREPVWRYHVLKVMTQMMLHALDYLHRVCHVVHTDIKPGNIMMTLEDKALLEIDAQDEYNHPLPQKKYADHTIYLSRNDFGQSENKVITGILSLTDFGFSVLGDGPHYGPIQAEAYRAPEVILDAGWTYSADIWSLGVMLCELLEHQILFDAVSPAKYKYHEKLHLGYITKLLGPPPNDLLRKGRRTPLFYNSSGTALCSSFVEIPAQFSLESALQTIYGEEKAMFIRFVSRMLKWKPEGRCTAKELLDDPWLGYQYIKIMGPVIHLKFLFAASVIISP
ncbi:hypothetical protein AMATHDRAFT_76928 [Amanita thiersii Skay4041]|uniref:non-specific serine/threonine protein kinase n=1 Tax=Amanita thiersii Skay4041 TaxID=703135 RepID=A0A2A9ND73_9AGAR|nr:hypothetical protein AMATHDRAFT_76928 [Amanita thiersii Skay4041]